MLVGISETIRSLSVYNLYIINFIILNLFRLFSCSASSACVSKSNNDTNENNTEDTNSKLLNNNLKIKNPDLYTIHSQSFFEWLGGLIDGDGCFLLSKKGYASLEITMDIRDQHCLYQIKQKFGGSVKLRSGVKAVRYRLHHKKGLLDLIKAVNGNIRNPVRILQLERLLNLYNIKYKSPKVLTYYNG
jgi:hypothetical protein